MAEATTRKTNGKLRSRGEVLVDEFYRWFPLEPVRDAARASRSRASRRSRSRRASPTAPC